MKALLVDDERLARVGLRQLLAAHPDVIVVGEAANCAQARAQCEQAPPDLLFLDIEMPGEDGFSLLETLDAPPHVIFTTAYASHAVHAFEVNAIDYLLKPVQAPRLAEALERVRRRVASTSRRVPVTGSPAAEPLERAFVRDGSRCYFIQFAEVSLLESEGNFTRLHLENERGQPFLARSLSYLEQRLSPVRFFRANRQQIFNLDHVERIDEGAGLLLVVTLRGGRRVELSRRQSQRFRERMRA